VTGRQPPGHGEEEDRMVAGPLLLGIGIGLLAGHLLVWIILGLGAGITLRSVVSGLGGNARSGRRVR
jgi:hypothetical protein